MKLALLGQTCWLLLQDVDPGRRSGKHDHELHAVPSSLWHGLRAAGPSLTRSLERTTSANQQNGTVDRLGSGRELATVGKHRPSSHTNGLDLCPALVRSHAEDGVGCGSYPFQSRGVDYACIMYT